MNDMKCPYCQQELEIGGVDGILRGCPKCRNLGTEILWQELIRTRKALMDTIKLAEEMLEYIKDEGLCSEYYEDSLNEIKTITKGGDNE